MIRNYFKITLRNLLKSRLYSLINISGLAVGLACVLMIGLFVQYEFTYDSFFPNADRIYRLSPNFEASPMGPARQPAANVAPLAPLLEQAGINGVEAVARIGGMHGLIERDDIVFNEDYLRWADNSFFEIFELNWLQGESTNALSRPFSVVITESLAQIYFGVENPMGQTLMLENIWPVQVTGVIGDISLHSHIRADLFVSMDTAWEMLGFNYENNWAYTNFHTYLKLDQSTDINAVMSQISDVVTGEDRSILDATLAQFFSISEALFSMTAFPLQDIHLASGRTGELGESGDMNTVMMFSVIALCLLLIACINFMNLSTARATQRAKEVGMRKAIGARKAELVRQFLGESMIMTVLAMIIALMLVELILPVFGNLLERELVFATLVEPVFMLFIIALVLLTGFLAGSYPAFYLSSFLPSQVLKYEAVNAGKTLTVRNLLVIFQFFLAISLIVATLVVSVQMRFVRNYELGFNKENVIELMGTHNQGLGSQWQVFKDDLLQYPDIVNITEEALFPGSAGNRKVRIEGGPDNGFDIRGKQVGFNFFETYQINLVAGRLFNEALSTDLFTPPANVEAGEQAGGTFVLNETAVRQLGWLPEDALGKRLEMDFSSDFSLTVEGSVIGVVEDIHLFSLRTPVQPLVFYVPEARWAGEPTFTMASVRLNSENIPQSLNLIRGKWDEYLPEIPFMYEYVDTYWLDAYVEEERQGELFSLFALLTIVIACLGLYGLASFTVQRRKKEIGVRKVMGGSVWSIVMLLTNDFSRLVLIANLIAWPVAYFAMNRWLENFAYRIDLTPLIFIGSGLIALCIAWVTVGGTAAKAASQKPVLALRYE